MAYLPAVGIIKVAAIIEAAATIEVAATRWMTISLNTIPRGATAILNANGVILNEDSIPDVLLTLIHPGNTLTGPSLHPDPTEGAGLILAAEPGPD